MDQDKKNEILNELKKMGPIEHNFTWPVRTKEGKTLEYITLTIFTDRNRIYLNRFIEIDGTLHREDIKAPAIPKVFMEQHQEVFYIVSEVADELVGHINEIIN